MTGGSPRDSGDVKAHQARPAANCGRGAVLQRKPFACHAKTLVAQAPCGYGERGTEQPVLVTRNGVSYEMALMAVFRAMGAEMPKVAA